MWDVDDDMEQTLQERVHLVCLIANSAIGDLRNKQVLNWRSESAECC